MLVCGAAGALNRSQGDDEALKVEVKGMQPIPGLSGAITSVELKIDWSWQDSVV